MARVAFVTDRESSKERESMKRWKLKYSESKIESAASLGTIKFQTHFIDSKSIFLKRAFAIQ